MIRCHYAKGPDGQIHWREWPRPDPSQRPLLCLHPAPYSGLYFTSVMPLLGQGRRVIAPDYPGYGGSTAPAEPPAIAGYADAMLALLDALELERVDILGFHTGCLVGAEMALRSPHRIGELVLVDVPYFVGAAREKMLEMAARPLVLGAGAETISQLWSKGVTARADSMPVARAVALLAEQLRVAERAHWAFHAAFTYPCEERLGALEAPVTVVATQSALLEATRACASLLEHARLEERLDITRAVFEEGAVEIASTINEAISGNTQSE